MVKIGPNCVIWLSNVQFNSLPHQDASPDANDSFTPFHEQICSVTVKLLVSFHSTAAKKIEKRVSNETVHICKIGVPSVYNIFHVVSKTIIQETHLQFEIRMKDTSRIFLIFICIH